MDKKKVGLILGNGFTIDLISNTNSRPNIDVINLFKLGDHIPWPETGLPGFLSYKHCPNLWNLGARPHMTTDESMQLLEDIITCVNVYAFKKKRDFYNEKTNDIYLSAYNELTSYLRALFSHYNNIITNDQLGQLLNDWPWLKYIQKLNDDNNVESIGIITYNYDIWLERALTANGINFNISGFDTENQNTKITLFKPHGSISFYHEKQSKAVFSINKNADFHSDATLSDFRIDMTHPLPQSKCLVNAMIPPAGDSDRLDHSWSGQIKKSAQKFIDTLGSGDEIMICGISYWHVDRAEIDGLLIGCDSNINMYMFNPKPNRSLNAVLTSLFSNYVLHTDSKILSSRI